VRSSWTALGIFVFLAAIHTWPLATDPAHLSRNDNADTLLNSWAIAWVAHQLPREPSRLFEANIYHPERLTLGYSEAMLVQGVLAMPILGAGGSPVLAYNLLLMAGLALTGWAFWLLIKTWTGNPWAAYIGGSLAAFNAHVLVRLPHLQAQHVEFIPLILFALDRLFVSRRVRDALLLGTGFALQGLTSVYILVFTSWMLIFAVLGRTYEWTRSNPRRVIALLMLSALTGTAIMAPYLLFYFRLHALTGLERTVDDARQFAGSWIDYLSTGSRWHYPLWSHTFFGPSASDSFPGIAGALLAGLALVWPETRRDPRVIMCLVAAIGCAAVSMAPHAPFFPTLHRLIPLFKAVRVIAHLGQIVLMLLAVLAGFGVAGLMRRWPSQRVALSLLLVVNLEALRAPLGYQPFTEIPRIYSDLAMVSNAVVVELPFWAPRTNHASGEYMLNSTRHWHPILNGYSGFRPDSYDATYDAIIDFPDDASLIALHARGVTHIVVHKNRIDPARFAAIAGISSLQLQKEDGEIYIYRLR
jgi:hypothetical protein